MSAVGVVRDERLDEVVRLLVGALRVRRIVLFDSRTTGGFAEDSDYDLIVVADTRLPADERSLVARRATRKLGVSLDIRVYTPEECTMLRSWRSSAVGIADSDGRVLYEAVG